MPGPCTGAGALSGALVAVGRRSWGGGRGPDRAGRQRPETAAREEQGRRTQVGRPFAQAAAGDADRALPSTPGHEDSGPGPVVLRRRKQSCGADPSAVAFVVTTVQGRIVMAIDFTLTPQQKVLQEAARDFAQNVLRPVVRVADEEPDPLRAFNLTKPAYQEAVNRGIAFSMLPK